MVLQSAMHTFCGTAHHVDMLVSRKGPVKQCRHACQAHKLLMRGILPLRHLCLYAIYALALWRVSGPKVLQA